MSRTLTYAQAIAEGTLQAMGMDPSVIIIGQGTRDAGQIFGSVEGCFAQFGSDRVIEMPLSENAITGICVGAAMSGLRPLYILQRADFVFLTMDQLINHASKYHFMFGGQLTVPLTMRLIIGKGWGQGPQHSQSLHSMLAHFPGLRVVAPADPYTAKGILLNSLFSDDPTVILEGRPLYSQTQEVPEAPYVYPFGKARRLREGSDITIVAVSFFVPEAVEAAKALESEGISAEVIDLVSINPLDIATIEASVRKTGRLLIADTSWSFCGISAEISAEIHARLFKVLKMPVERLTPPFSPTPTAAALEKQFYPTSTTVAERCRVMLKK